MSAAVAAEPPFRRVCIAGVGLIGGSIARRARRTWPAISLAGVDRAAVLDSPDAAGLLNEHANPDRLADVAAASDLTILATPVPVIVEQVAQLRGVSSLVTDAGSTKRAVMAATHAAGLSRFTGGHPMAGSERSGLTHAHADLFSARRWFLVHGSAGVDDERRLEAFVVGLGAEPVWLDADAHDRAMAFVSHLPQVMAVALHNAAATALGSHMHATSGRAFFEMTRIAVSAPDLWEGIIATNADYVSEAIAGLMRELPGTSDALDDGAWVRRAFERAAAIMPPTRKDR